VIGSFSLRVPGPVHIVPCCIVYQWAILLWIPLFFSLDVSNPSGNNQHGPAKSKHQSSDIFRCETGCILEHADSGLQATFEQFGRYKNGSSLSATEQQNRLNVLFPCLNTKSEIIAEFYHTCQWGSWSVVLQENVECIHQGSSYPQCTEEYAFGQRGSPGIACISIWGVLQMCQCLAN